MANGSPKSTASSSKQKKTPGASSPPPPPPESPQETPRITLPVTGAPSPVPQSTTGANESSVSQAENTVPAKTGGSDSKVAEGETEIETGASGTKEAEVEKTVPNPQGTSTSDPKGKKPMSVETGVSGPNDPKPNTTVPVATPVGGSGTQEIQGDMQTPVAIHASGGSTKKTGRKKSKGQNIEIVVEGSESTTKKKPQRRYKKDPNAPLRSDPCPHCHKKFASNKGLHGHMKTHPERPYRGVNPPPGMEVTPPPVPEDANLSMLANEAIAAAIEIVEKLPWEKHTCSCGKEFSSFQALGGHRASHRDVKGCYAAEKMDGKGENAGDSNQGHVLALRNPTGLNINVPAGIGIDLNEPAQLEQEDSDDGNKQEGGDDEDTGTAPDMNQALGFEEEVGNTGTADDMNQALRFEEEDGDMSIADDLNQAIGFEEEDDDRDSDSSLMVEENSASSDTS